MDLKLLILIFSYFGILLIGCKPKSINQSVESIISGEWKLDYTNQEVQITDSTICNIIFKEDKKCSIFPGFYSLVFEDPRTFITYLGSSTDFSVEGELLKIYNLSNKNWDQYKIEKLTSDTLVIETSLKDQLLFIKMNVKKKFKNDFDGIVLITDGIYKFLSNYKIYLDRSGKMSIQLNGYDNLYGNQTCIVDKKLTDSIFSLFEYSKISELKHQYNKKFEKIVQIQEPRQKITLAFFNENKIIKEIDITDDSAPIDLYLAYDPVRTIYKSKNCQCKKGIIRDNLVNISSEIQTSNEKGYIKLSDAEQFYINCKIYNAKETKGSINHKYKIKGAFTDLFTFSDGRFIRIEGSEKIYDVGYWFIDSTKINLY
ncbi:MAG: hypothetical protein IPM42_08050 [Saprospiraceae bacterium]|nr:hypothetical protein [Saprospiraceae bacterium]